MDTYDMIKKLSDSALDKGKEYNGDGSNNYAYSFGCFVGEIEYVLDDLELTPKQLDLLQKSINKRVG